MSTFRNPVGPQPANVYWRRRLVVGLGVLAVILVIVLIVVRPGADMTPTSSGEPTVPSDSEDGNGEDEPEPGASGAPDAPCNPAVIDLVPTTDNDNYSSGVNPRLGLSITNNGAVACSFNVGTSQQEFQITSGSELYWTSKHCQTEQSDQVISLAPGVTLSTDPTELIVWDRTRSAEGSCGGDRPKVPAGGASYHLKVIVGEVESAGTKQFLLH